MKKFVGLVLVMLFMMLNMGCIKLVGSRNLEYAEPSGIAQEINSTTVALVGYPEKADGSFSTVYQPYCTGVWVTKDIFLTAYHCVDDLASKEDLKSGKVKVHFLDQKQVINVYEQPKGTYEAVVKYVDPTHDLAMIQAGIRRPKHDVAHISKISPGIGTRAHMVGHVSGLYYTYVEGVISSYRDKYPIKSIGPFMQVSASIYFGNSGGGVFNDDGELLGICSFLTKTAPNTSFYIPSPVILHFLREYKIKN